MKGARTIRKRLESLVERAKDLGRLESETGIHTGSPEAETSHNEKLRRQRSRINTVIKNLETTFSKQKQKLIKKVIENLENL